MQPFYIRFLKKLATFLKQKVNLRTYEIYAHEVGEWINFELVYNEKARKKSRRDHVDDESIMQSHLQYKRFD